MIWMIQHIAELYACVSNFLVQIVIVCWNVFFHLPSQHIPTPFNIESFDDGVWEHTPDKMIAVVVISCSGCDHCPVIYYHRVIAILV